MQAGGECGWGSRLARDSASRTEFGSAPAFQRSCQPFWAKLATMLGNHRDRALRLDTLLAGSSLHRFRYPR